jgi:hypothetical protein
VLIIEASLSIRKGVLQCHEALHLIIPCVENDLNAVLSVEDLNLLPLLDDLESDVNLFLVLSQRLLALLQPQRCWVINGEVCLIQAVGVQGLVVPFDELAHLVASGV